MWSESQFQSRLQRGCELLEFELDVAGSKRLYRYFCELRKWSRKINLIARGSSDEDILASHFLDSLTLLPLLTKGDCRLLDVGTGAGFPGLVLKAWCPALPVTLVEPRLKRVTFLNHVIRTLALPEVQVVAARLEESELMAGGGRRYSHVVSRAVADIAGFLELAAPCIDQQCQLICMKGPKYTTELAAASSTLDGLAIELVETRLFTLPFSGAERAVLVFRRSGNG